MITVSIHDEFQFQIPDYFETHYKEEDEDLSQSFVARYHPEDPEWEHFGTAEQSIGVSKQFHGGFDGIDYSNSQVQELVLSKMKLVILQMQMAMMKSTGGLLSSTILDPADDCPYVYHAEKRYIILIIERAKDFSEVQVHLEINDSTSYEIKITHSQDSESNKAFLESVLDSFSMKTLKTIDSFQSYLSGMKDYLSIRYFIYHKRFIQLVDQTGNETVHCVY